MKLNMDYKNGYTIYNVSFDNLADLYYYLKSDPEVNYDIFYNDQASINGEKSFAGDSLKKSIEYIVEGYPYGYDNFLIASERMQNATLDSTDSRDLKRGIYGGIPLAPLVAAEVPDCMLRYERNKDNVIRNMYFSLAYPHYNSKESIYNRGLSTLYIVDALEKKGDIVNLVAMESSVCSDEIVNIEILLKKPTDAMLDLKKCYFPIAGPEFLRRILFRVLESMPVKNNWNYGYGRALEEEEFRKFFELKDSDLVVSTPNEIGICGDNMYSDTARLIDNLDLNQEFDVDKIKKLGHR